MKQHTSLLNIGGAIGAEIENASTLLASVGVAASIFGGARIATDSPYYHEARKLAGLLAQAQVTVISGGGPGIMEAANQGAHAQGGVSVGLNITLPHEQSGNKFQTLSAPFHHFPSRKTTFVAISDAFIAFPGGFGTLDELFEVLTLIQTKKSKAAPVVLVGRTFWSGLVEWIASTLREHKVIGINDPALVTVVDTAEEAMAVLSPFLSERKASQSMTA